MKSNHFDVIVVGLGAMGSAVTYQLSKSGTKVLGIDRYHPPHHLGSSHAETRITRLVVGEGRIYVPLVARSHEIWRELELATGEQLFFNSGGYIIGPRKGGALFHGSSDFVSESARLAIELGLDHEMLSANEIMSRHSVLKVPQSDHAFYEPSSGIVLCEKAIKCHL